MELRQLRYVMALVQEGHFGRAAERLHIAQPTLSQEIRRLERELHVTLFDRTPKGVVLTDAGRRLLADIEQVAQLADRIALEARSLARAASGTLRVGFVAATAPPLVPSIVRRFADLHPAVEVDLVEASIQDPSAGLGTRDVDVALIWPPVSVVGLHERILLSDPRVAVLPAGHRLESAPWIRIDDLHEDPFVTVDAADPIWADFWVAGPERSAPPVLGPTSRSMDGLFALVAAGRGVGLAPRGLAANLAWAGVCAVPVIDIPPATLAVAHRHDTDRSVVSAFVDVAIAVARPKEPQGGSGSLFR